MTEMLQSLEDNPSVVELIKDLKVNTGMLESMYQADKLEDVEELLRSIEEITANIREEIESKG